MPLAVSPLFSGTSHSFTPSAPCSQVLTAHCHFFCEGEHAAQQASGPTPKHCPTASPWFSVTRSVHFFGAQQRVPLAEERGPPGEPYPYRPSPEPLPQSRMTRLLRSFSHDRSKARTQFDTCNNTMPQSQPRHLRTAHLTIHSLPR